MEFDINWVTVILSFISSIIGAFGAPLAAFHFWKLKCAIIDERKRAEIESAINGLAPDCIEILGRFVREGDGLRLKNSDSVRVLHARKLIRCVGGTRGNKGGSFLYVIDDLARDLIRERLRESECKSQAQ